MDTFKNYFKKPFMKKKIILMDTLKNYFKKPFMKNKKKFIILTTLQLCIILV